MRIGIATLALLTVTLAEVPRASAEAGDTADALSAPRPRSPSQTRVVIPDPPSSTAPIAVGAVDEESYPNTSRAREVRFLQSSLAYLSYLETNSIVDGLLHTMMGGVWIGFGAGINGLDPSIKAYYFVQGSSMLARAALAFAIRPNAKRASLEMDAMVGADARLAYGAGALKKLSKQHRIKRLLGSTLSIASGILPLPFVLNSGVDSFTGGWSIIVFVGAGIDIITGIIGLSIRTEAEKRQRAYDELRTPRTPRVEEVSLGFMPVLGGGGLSLRLFY